MRKRTTSPPPTLQKVPTGIHGFDSITGGGLPSGRPTLVCGAAGCGKSIFAAEFLIHGALEHDAPGVLMTFEETAEDIKRNLASLGHNLDRLIARKKLVIDHVHIEREEIEENGEYDLEGLFIRLGHAVDAIGARRVVLDTIESLFSGLANEGILRAELRRLFRWLRTRNLTTIVTGERGTGQLTRHGLEEYVSDCVVLLDHRVHGQVSTRRMRVVKYRGSTHGTNEYPFLIDETGITVLPITSATLDYAVTSERIPTGIAGLDEMLGGGFYRGSSILLSGTAGTGKTTVCAHLADETCRRGERCLFFSFEESPAQILRNMRQIGINLGRRMRAGRLKFHAVRPTMFGLETHLAQMHRIIAEFQPHVVVVDPVTNLRNAGTVDDSTHMLMRLIDLLRKQGITTLLASLTGGGQNEESTDVAMSSNVDSWLLLRDMELGGERNRAIYVLKSRGMAHSNQVREFLITAHGVRLVPAYLGPAGAPTGAARAQQAAREQSDPAAVDLERRRIALDHRRKSIEAQIAALQAGLATEQAELEWAEGQYQQRLSARNDKRPAMTRSLRTSRDSRS